VGGGGGRGLIRGSAEKVDEWSILTEKKEEFIGKRQAWGERRGRKKCRKPLRFEVEQQSGGKETATTFPRERRDRGKSRTPGGSKDQGREEPDERATWKTKVAGKKVNRNGYGNVPFNTKGAGEKGAKASSDPRPDWAMRRGG